MSISDRIKDSVFEDFRQHFNGVICIILDSKEYMPFGNVLKVIPENYDIRDATKGAEIRPFNVVCINSTGVMGICSNIKDKYYAYVFTDYPTLIEGKLAVLIPKTFLNRDISDSSEKDMVSQGELDNLITRKDSYVISRKAP